MIYWGELTRKKSEIHAHFLGMDRVLRSLAAALLLLLPGLTAAAAAVSTSSAVRVESLRQRLRQLVEPGVGGGGRGVIVIDGDNVRGKTKFRLSNEELCVRVQEWMAASALSGLVVLLFDHGSRHSGVLLPDPRLAVVFSGPGRTADDVITRDVGWFQSVGQRDVVVVTEDNGLKRRCRTSLKGRASARGKKKKAAAAEAAAATAQKELTFVGSPLFSEMLLALRPLDVADDATVPAAAGTPPLPSDATAATQSAEVALMRKEVDLRRQLSGIQSALARCNRKAAVRLRKREDEVKARLTAMVGAASDVRSVQGGVDGGGAGDVKAVVVPAVEDTPVPIGGGDGTVVDRGAELLARVLARGRPPGTEEETWERVILAEHLRFRLEQLHPAVDAGAGADAAAVHEDCPAQAYVQYINRNFAQVQKSTPSVVKTA